MKLVFLQYLGRVLCVVRSNQVDTDDNVEHVRIITNVVRIQVDDTFFFEKNQLELQDWHYLLSCYVTHTAFYVYVYYLL